MRHCVSMYTGLVQRHKVAIFSLRKDDQRVGTLEVSLGAGAVVQAKGLANRSLTSEESAVVQLWAAESRLRLRV
jgi:PcfJ-like protein